MHVYFARETNSRVTALRQPQGARRLSSLTLSLVPLPKIKIKKKFRGVDGCVKSLWGGLWHHHGRQLRYTWRREYEMTSVCRECPAPSVKVRVHQQTFILELAAVLVHAAASYDGKVMANFIGGGCYLLSHLSSLTSARMC